MAVAAHDGGGGDGFPHSTGRYDPGTIVSGGTGDTSGGPHSQSGLEQGGRVIANASPIGFAFNLGSSLFGNGARDKVAQALSQSDPATVADHAQKWQTISTTSNGYATQVYDAMSHLSTWSGDDADKARAVLQGLAATFGSASRASSSMSHNLNEMAGQLKWAKDNYGDAGGVASDVGNALTGGGGDDEAANAYQNMLKNFETSMGYMPTSVPYEVKDQAGPGTYSPPTTPNGGGPGVGGAPTAGGPGVAPHVGNPTNPTLTKPPELPEHPQPPYPEYPEPPRTDPPTVDPPTYDNPGYDNTGYSPYTGGGAGISPGLDTSGSLAGYDGAGAGGAGSLGGGAGAGGGVPGGLPGGGAGAANGAMGAGAGGLGSGGLGSGGGGGGVVGGAAAGRGGMMPMHGGHNNDDDERERSTWLNEDDDVWGAEESLPGVIN